jgi:hypothetical protein
LAKLINLSSIRPYYETASDQSDDFSTDQQRERDLFQTEQSEFGGQLASGSQPQFDLSGWFAPLGVTGDTSSSSDTPGSLGPFVLPNLVETTDAVASTSTTYSLGIGQTAQGNLSTGSDHDWWRVNLVAGQTYTFAEIGTGLNRVGGNGDTYLRLRDSTGSQITFNDDSGPGLSSSLTYTATSSGTYYLDAGSFGDSYSGQYGLSASTGTRATFDEVMGAGAI